MIIKWMGFPPCSFYYLNFYAVFVFQLRIALMCFFTGSGINILHHHRYFFSTSAESPSAKVCQEALGDEPKQNDSLTKAFMPNE